SHGYNVDVLEVRSKEQLQAQAAGLSLWPNAQKVLTTYIPEVELNDVVFRNPSFRSSIIRNDDHLTVAYKGEDGTEDTIPADLVIAADGARSYFRSLVLPDVKPEYVGYVAWRAASR
ncbi:UbiH 2-polyprenyl-6-methoxyphenol hydroxylase, partial [Pyrenophora tritici-repentis]